ncbi:MAG: DUF2069 domain-containing protein, partial [Burkholderiaceae bacterium]|nr:DUF2069 domain-containing protein [Burkholderiaceae bacterium]
MLSGLLKKDKYVLIASAAIVDLIVLCVAWEWLIAPLRPGGSWLILKAVPLIIMLPGVWRANVYTMQWSSMAILIYTTEALTRITESGWNVWMAILEVAKIVKACDQALISIVPQGGNTSMCGAATPNDSGQQIVLNLKRMNAIREINPSNQTMVVESGCILQTVQEAAKTQGFLFPLSLGAQGSCQIGGNLATNAGGTNVLRYGNARELCLGLEVVTAQGEILHGLRSLRKDNTGFDLRDLYIGSEGCLGIITAAVMKLYPLPVTQWTALVAVPNIPATIELLSLFQKRTAALLTGFEMMSKDSLDLTAKQFPHMKNPLANDPLYTVLVELSDHEGEEHARNLMEQVLEAAFEAGIANDAVIASNLSQAQSFWTMREHITMAQAQEGANLKHDISLPISELDAFITETDQLIRDQFAGIRIINFGHLGDGNLHYNIAPPLGVNASEFNRVHEEAIHDVVYSQVEKHHGSI